MKIKVILKLVFSLIFSGICIQTILSNVYVVIYATIDGKTGHAGLAIDKYNILVYDINNDKSGYYKYDTVKIGSLCYFDLWPEIDHFGVFTTGKNIKPIYYKLPQSTFNEDLTVNTFYYKGIPKSKANPL